MFECERCHYTTNVITNMKKHLKTKQPCNAIFSDVSQIDVYNKLFPIKEGEYICAHCNRTFTTIQGLWYHTNKSKKKCGKEPKNTQSVNSTNESILNDPYVKLQEQTIHTLQLQIDGLQQKVKELEGKNISYNVVNNITNINSNNNTQTQHTNVYDFRDIDGDHIPENVLTRLIDRIKSSDLYYDVFQKVLELIYFDKQHPETHALILPNIKQKFCKIIKDGKPCFAEKETITDMTIHETRNTLHDKYEENPYQYSIMTRQTMTKMDNKYEEKDKGHIKALKDKTDIALLNSKQIVLDTWKYNGF